MHCRPEWFVEFLAKNRDLANEVECDCVTTGGCLVEIKNGVVIIGDAGDQLKRIVKG